MCKYEAVGGGSGPSQMILVRSGIIYFSTIKWIISVAENKSGVWFLPLYGIFIQFFEKIELLGEKQTPWGCPDPPTASYIGVTAVRVLHDARCCQLFFFAIQNFICAEISFALTNKETNKLQTLLYSENKPHGPAFAAPRDIQTQVVAILLGTIL